MAKLWEKRTNQKRLNKALNNLTDVQINLEHYTPYKRLYRNLSRSQLLNLMHDAKVQRWEALDLRWCGLDELPEELGELTDLRVLAFGNWESKSGWYGERNSFTSLPDSIGDLENLQSLDLLHTDITFLPSSIGDLRFLRSLVLENSLITALPKSIGRLSSLQELILYNTQIQALPESIGQLSSLRELILGCTEVTQLPESFGRLSSLQLLDLSETNITKIPESIGQLANLELLNLSDTDITEIPESIGQLANLQLLDCHNTRITTLPESLGRLSKLKTLNLCSCHLQSIPYSVVQLGLPFFTDDRQAENCVNLTDVILDEGDLSLFEHSREIIEEYYLNRIPEEFVNECKVIFLGDGGAGKSSLIERIMNGDFNPGSLPTDGVRMLKWNAYSDGSPLSVDGKPLKVRFLDFGGQEIMHSMHRCFLTGHTVYVVVCESRDDAEIDGVASRWMETVKSFAPGCPVLLALNKVDMNDHVTVNERMLKERNPLYRHMIRTSAKTGKGIETLVNDILAEVPDCLRKMVGNRAMLSLKQELEDMKDNYITPEQFQDRCEDYNIPMNLRKEVLDWFQDLGVAYTYSTPLQEIYVLNPEWLTNGIYRLILRTPDGGFLTHKVIRDTLAEPHPNDIKPNTKYTAQEMEYILYIMRKFKISLNIPRSLGNGDEIEMIPMKMTKTPPPRYSDFQKEGALHLRWEAGYLPNNLIHRLMIRNYEDLDPWMEPDAKCIWRTGGWFQRMDGGGEALAEMTDSALDLYVHPGRDERDPRLYMDNFRQQILRILRDLGIEAKELIVCTVNGKTGRIPYEYVMNRRRKGKKEIYLGDIDEDVSIEELLKMNYVYAGEEPRDFFISYNNESDKARAAWIAKTLRENRYSVHFQADDCKPGMNFPKWMEEALAHSRGFLAVWSKAYEESRYCEDELYAAYVKAHKDEQFKVLPVRVENVPVKNTLFACVVRVDVFSSDESKNRENLLRAVNDIRQTR